MTIKEVEEQTGLARSNIRFYEKEGLFEALRNESNGYREYSEENIEEIKKIAYLRTLGVSIEDIRKLIRREADLYGVIEKQSRQLEKQLSELRDAKAMCESILSNQRIDYDSLDVGKYVKDLEEYWKENRHIFKIDSARLIWFGGGIAAWGIVTAISLIAAVCFVNYFPPEIPIQWSGGIATSFVNKRFIFAYPLFCMVARFLLRPFLERWLHEKAVYHDAITNYVTNCLCFIAVSVEFFTILFVKGIVKNVVIVLLIDTIVLMGALLLFFVNRKL